MRSTIYLFLIIAVCNFVACKEDISPEEKKKDQFLTKVIGEDYKDKLSIPITEDGQVDTANMASILFEDPIQQFDTIYQGDKVSHEFTFTNTGAKNLYILDSSTSCGCTVASYTKDAVPPGSTGKVVINYDSKDRKGEENKKVKIYANTYPNESVIELKGFVIETKK